MTRNGLPLIEVDEAQQKNQTWHVPLSRRLDEERGLDSFRL